MENKKIKLILKKAIESFNKFSISLALAENGLGKLVTRLRKIVPDISNQEESEKAIFNHYSEVKRRALQAFQCSLMLKGLENLSAHNLTVVDIGDSAGTHMLYLKELTKDRFNLDTISVNLDPRAIEKIKARGLKAMLCRAEDLDLGGKEVDLFVSFQMVEHLHNPAIFLYRLTQRTNCQRMVITLPYLRASRLGLYRIRNNSKKITFAEDEHIFELNPDDWRRLMLHSGWRVIYQRIYFQYPRRLPTISQLLSLYWRKTDFEGFLGVILEKDTAFSDNYKDWED